MIFFVIIDVYKILGKKNIHNKIIPNYDRRWLFCYDYFLL